MINLLKSNKTLINISIALIPLPFLGNFLLNIYENQLVISFLSIKNLIFSFISFLFLYNFCSLISQASGFKNISFCISIFYISFYAVNFLILNFGETVQNFDHYFYLVISLWMIYLIYNFKFLNKLNIFLSIFSFLVIKLIKNYILDKNYSIPQFSSDTGYFWTPMSKAIYDNSLYYALENNIITGYGLLINYIHSINFKLFINEDFFYFHTATTNIFLFLYVLFIWEINAPKNIKYSGIIILLSILLNSDWLSFLFINSSMGEGITNYLFAVIFLTLINTLKKYQHNLNSYELYTAVFFAGFLYFTKPFASYLILLIILWVFSCNKKVIILLLGFSGVFINFFNYSYIISGNTSDGYLNLAEFSDTEKLYNLKLNNILQILLNFFTLDKIMSLFIVILVILTIYNLIKLKSFSPIFLLLLFNALLVFLLYVSVWQNKELESAYRYLLTLLNLYFVLYVYELKKIFYKS